MQIEGWMMTALAMVATVIGTIAVMRYQVAANEKSSERTDLEIKTRQDKQGEKLDEHDAVLRELREKIENKPSMKEVRTEFVTKEFFRLHQEHVDKQFTQVNSHIDSLGNSISKKFDDLAQELRRLHGAD